MKRKNNLPISEKSKRLLDLISALGLTGYKLEKVIPEFTQSKLTHIKSGRNELSNDLLDKMITKWPSINVEWLLTGNGGMFKGQESSAPINPECLYYAPKLPVSAMAGTLEGFTSSINQWDLENIVVPIKGIDLVIPISGDSMKPDYPEGSLLLTKKIDEKAFIEWGKVFVLDTRNGVVIKQVYPGDEESKIKCVSINTAYPSFDVYKSDIFGWYIVLMIMARK